MAKYRPKKSAIVEAKQWFPGVKIDGVCGDDPNKICGCVLVGLDGNKPHIHRGMAYVPISEGNWIVKDADGKHDLCKPDVFEETYEFVED